MLKINALLIRTRSVPLAFRAFAVGAATKSQM